MLEPLKAQAASFADAARRSLLRWGLVMVSLLFIGEVLAADCAVTLARLVSVQGSVELQRVQTTQWSAVSADTELCPGDALRVGPRSRAALRLANESILRLDQDTTLTLAADDPRISVLELLRGALNVITRTPTPFRVRTPFVNAGVEGTEFLVRVDTDSARIAVFEGSISAANDLGSIVLSSGEAALASPGSAPRRERVVRPADAIQWALYYPRIISPGQGDEAALQEADVLARRGRIGEAFAWLDAVPLDGRAARYRIYRAELLLSVGRVDEAREDIERALAADQRSGEALALQSIIAVVQNEGTRALQLAQEAVQLAPGSAAARIAWSYAQQARFDIAAALVGAEQATRVAPDDAIAWARVAELRLAQGDLDTAVATAQLASGLAPDLARTQTVLGFAHLTRIETAAARQAFRRAIELDQSDPLPRLGLGLARIRDSEFSAGRQEIEIAAALDPENSLIRSYLGKAYFEERRDALAEIQYALGRAKDPLDPTPYFYDAIRAYAANRPLASLDLVDNAIRLNDRRAVLRSRLLLDNDAASRIATQALALDKAGFTQIASGAAYRAWAEDPANPFGHHFLASAYASQPRHEQARSSELLQAQFLDSRRIIRADPLTTDDRSGPKFRIGPTGGFRFGASEYFNLFDSDRPIFHIDGLTAKHNTLADIVSFETTREALSFGASQFHYRSDGFEPNTDARRDSYDGIIKWRLTPWTNLIAEISRSETERGNTLFGFDSDLFLPLRYTEKSDSSRFGLRQRLTLNSDLLLHALQRQGDTTNSLPDEVPAVNRERARLFEAQYLFHGHDIKLSTGLAWMRSDTKFFGPPFFRTQRHHRSAFALATLHPLRPLWLDVGVGYDASFVNDESSGVGEIQERRKWTPRIGMTWSPAEATTIRAANFQSVKRRLVVNQTLEPTQIAGFNQFYDDPNGTIARRLGIGVDHRLSATSFIGMQGSSRRLDVPAQSLAGFTDYRWRETEYKAYFYKAFPSQHASSFLSEWEFTAGLEFQSENLRRPEDLTGDESILGLHTRILPLSFRGFHSSGVTFRLAQTFIDQKGELLGSSKFGINNRFSVVDLDLTAPLGKRQGVLSMGIRNLFGKRFSFVETDPLSRRFPTDRYWLIRASVQF
jgi:ferric-dicitrate binding protein FerR (iron transport regulator)